MTMIVKQDVVSSSLGNFGLWQARGFLIIALVKIPAAWQMLSIIYTAPNPIDIGGRYWCARPPTKAWSVQQWINISQPCHHTNKHMRCDPCRVIEHAYTHDVNTSLTFIEATPVATRDCTDYAFEFDQPFPTITSQWALVCRTAIMVSVIQSCYLLGIFLGGIITFFLLKWLSPRWVLLASSATQIAVGVGSAYVPYYQAHAVLKALTGLSACVMFSVGFIICTDITSGWQRTVICASYEYFWSIGVISLGWLSDLCGSWINLQLTISIPTALIFLLFPWIPDSPRWHLNCGNIVKAYTILQNGAVFNGRKMPPIEIDTKRPSTSPAVHGKERLPMDKIVALQIMWIVAVYYYYGGLLNLRSVGGPRLPIRTSIAGVIEIVGTTVGMILLLRSSHKYLIVAILLAIGGAACVGSWGLPMNSNDDRGGWPMLCLAMAGRVAIACSLAVLSCGGSAEWIPVSRRPIVILTLATVARFFLMSAPFFNTLAQYDRALTLGIYGALIISSAVASFYLAAFAAARNKVQKNSQQALPPASTAVNTGRESNFKFAFSQRPITIWTLPHSGEIVWNEEDEQIKGVYFNPCLVNDDGV